MKRFGKWLLPVAIISLLLATLIGGSCAPQPLGEVLDPSGNPFAHRFSDVTDIRTATFVVAASDSEHKYEADYFCDGTNDHVQIQQAIDALPATGGEVKLLDGTYNISVGLILDSYQTLRGCGRNTILNSAVDNIHVIAATGGDGTEKVGLLIADLYIDGPGGMIGNGIVWTYVDYSTISHVWSVDCQQDAIMLDNCDFNEISDNFCTSSFSGIRLFSSSHNTISGNTCQGNNNVGIYLYDYSHNTVSGNTCQGNGASGIILGPSSSHNTISGNTCQGNGDEGIYVSNSSNNTVSANTCQGNVHDGIWLNNSSPHNTISGNTCQGNGNDGITIDDYSSYNTISGNTCQGNGAEGILIYDYSSYNTITGNTCQMNGGGGIYLHQYCFDNTVSGNICSVNSQGADNTSDHIRLYYSDYNLIEGNLCRAPTIGTTLTVGEPIGETEIAVTAIAGFEVGMGVVIDLGGGNEEYHRIVALAAGVITIDAGLTNAQGAGETIDVPEAKYGIEIPVGSDKNVVVGNDLYDAGKTANLLDASQRLTTVTEDNRDITPVQVKHLIYAQNTSGGNLLAGNVVKYNAAAGSVGFTTPTAVGDDGVWGMLVENIADTAFGYIQVLGGTLLLDATNAGGAIVIGDFLCAEIGVRARLAAAGDMAFAIALEDCDAADAIIDALIITPRKI